MALVTLDNIKTYLGIPLANSDYDDLLTIFQESIEQSVIHFCCTDFAPTVVTNEIHDGVQADVIVPKNSPIISVQDVQLDVTVAGAGGSSLDPTTDYYYDQNAIILRNFHTPHSRGIVRVDYTWGYASVPGDVKLAVYQAIKAEFQLREKNAEDISSRSKGDESESFNVGSRGAAWDAVSGLPSKVAAKLQPYRVYEVPNINTAQRNV